VDDVTCPPQENRGDYRARTHGLRRDRRKSSSFVFWEVRVLATVTGDNGCRHSERIVSHPLANLTHQAWLFGALLILSSTVDVTRCSKPGYVSVNGSG
jgi:hypothetical protein